MFLKKLFNFIPRNEFSKALDLYNRGDYRKALHKFEDLIENNESPENLDLQTIELYACEAHVGLSKYYSDGGDLESAVDEMEKAVALKPNFADLRYNLGNLHFKIGNTDKAVVNLRKSLEINPKFFKARVILSKLLLAGNDIEGCSRELSTAEEVCPNFYREKLNELNQALRISGKDANVEKLYTEILEEKPTSAQLSRELAVEAIHNGNNTEAIRELKKAIALNPDYPDLHNYLGIAYGNNGMLDDSIEEFERALKINPYYMKARLNMALAMYEKGEFPEAGNHLSKVLEVQPKNELANNLLAELNAVKGR